MDVSQIQQNIEEGGSRLDVLNAELAEVDSKIREREQLIKYLDWLQSFPFLDQEDAKPAQQDLTPRTEAAKPEGSEPEPEPEPEPVQEPEPVPNPGSAAEVRALKLPELKTLAEHLGLGVKGNKPDFIEAICEHYWPTPDGPEEPPAPIPEAEAAPAPEQPAPVQEQPAPVQEAPAPASKSPFSF